MHRRRAAGQKVSRTIGSRRSAGLTHPSVALVAAEPLEPRAMLAATPVPLVSLLEDTGASGSDRITSNGALNVVSAAGATVEYSTSGGTSWATTFTAKEGVNSVRVRQTLAPSTPSAPVTLVFTLDTKAPAPLAVSLATDTGSSKTDRVTQNPALSFVDTVTKKPSLEAGAIVQYYNDNELVWQSTYAPVEGLNTVSVRQVDKAGNPSAPATLEFTLDRVGPVAPGVGLKNDTNLPGDAITADGTLTVATTGDSALEAGAAVQYAIDGKTWKSTFAPKSGVNSVQIRQVDAAGNPSAGTAFKFTFDNVAPAKPLVVLKTDTGTSTTDRITRDPTLSFVNTAKQSSIEAGAVVEYATLGVDGKTWSGWSNSFTPAEGANSVKIRQIDLAGNKSVDSAPLSFTLFQQELGFTVTSVPAAKTYLLGDKLSFSLGFSRPVIVTPLTGVTAVPNIDVLVGDAVRKAVYVGGSGTATLQFTTVVLPGDEGTVALGGTIGLPTNAAKPSLSAAIRDLAGNVPPTAFIPPELSGVIVDARVPELISMTFERGEKSATIEFSRPVTGVTVSDFRVLGSASGLVFDLPLTDSRVVAQIGKATVTGSGTTWKLSVERLPTTAGSVYLSLIAAGSGIVDTELGRPLVTGAGTPL